MKHIIAVVGLCGAGKSEAVKFFEEAGYKRVYFGDVVLEELVASGLEVNEKNERFVREGLRKDFGMSAMAIKSIDKIREYYKIGNVVIESLYSWSEYKILVEEFGNSFKLLTIHTDKALRYARLDNRKYRKLTTEESISRDFSEIENLEKGGPIAFCDYLVTNNETLKILKEKINSIIEK